MLTWNELENPWLIAAWPGPGNVGLGAGRYLVDNLPGAVSPMHPPTALCEIDGVKIKNGLASADTSHAMFHTWKDPDRHQDMVIFTDHSPPSAGSYAYSAKVIDYAVRRGVTRLVTFASMATERYPAGGPHAVATERGILRKLRDLDVNIISGGRISGLYGAALAAAEKRGLEAVCLLGEVPNFAMKLPNPAAAHAILEVLVPMAGISLDFTELEHQVAAVDEKMGQWIRKIKHEADEQGFAVPDFLDANEEDDQEQNDADDEQRLDRQTQRRIEALFANARDDRSKAGELKAELDRHRVFPEYEDRFLDLFKKTE